MFADLARDVAFVLQAAHDVNDTLLGTRVEEVTDELRAIEDELRCAHSYLSFGRARLGELIIKAGG